MSTIPIEIAQALKDARQLAFEANMRTNIRVDGITPYTETKKAYYAEIEKVFYGVPLGNVSVFFDNYVGEYKMERISDRLIITFPERLKDMTNITIKVEQ